MEILTQVVVLLAVGRAMGLRFGGVRAGSEGESWVTGAERWGLVMMVVAGLAAHLDGLSALLGAERFFYWHRTLGHSGFSGAVIAVVVACVFWWLGRRNEKQPVHLVAAVYVCMVGVAVRTVMDLATSEGVRLLWPFADTWFAWDLMAPADPWILMGGTVALAFPVLVALITEEIGAKKKKGRVDRGAVVALVLVTVYLGGRAWIHGEVTGEMDAVVYRGAIPKKVAAFPNAGSPYVWRGIAETANTIEEVEANWGADPMFEPDRSLTIYKPEASAALTAAGTSEMVKAYMGYARFAKASVEKIDAGWRVRVEDLRFGGALEDRRRVIVVMLVDGAGRVVEEEFQFQ